MYLFLLPVVFSGFNCLLIESISSKRKTKDFFPGPALASKQAFFCHLKFGDYSAISRVVVVLVTIVTSHVESLRFLEDLPTLLVTDFLSPIGSEEGLGPLVLLIFSKFSKFLK
jgi:hypothetical protein